MAHYYGRAAWTSSAPPVARLVALDPAHVRGIAVHHTGSSVPLGGRSTFRRSARRLEDDRLLVTADRGWPDIAYQVAVDVDGRVFECRGLEFRPQANGNATANAQYGAVTLLLGAGDELTPAMIDAFGEWRRTRWLARYPTAIAVVGHRDLYPTPCPGHAVDALIRSGTL